MGLRRRGLMTGCWLALTVGTSAQPLTLPEAPVAPRGYGAVAAAPMPAALGPTDAADGGWTELLPDLTIRAVASLYHDTNPGQSPDTAAFPAEPGMTGSIAPEFEWSREAAWWKAAVVAGGAHDEHFDNSRYNSERYRLKGQFDVELGRWDLRTLVEHDYNDGINRYFGEAFAESNERARITLAYELSPKTSLKTRWQSAWNEREGGRGSNENHTLLTSGIWRYSPLLELGPGLSIKRSTNSRGRRRDTIGPTFSAGYQLSRKVGIISEIGMDFVDYSNGRSDSFLSTRIAADYRLSRLWSFNLSVLRDVEPDGPAGSGFREVTAMNLGVRRQVRRMSLGLAAGYETNDYASESGAAGTKPGLDFTTLQLDLRFPILSDQLGGMLFIRRQESRSDSANDRWDSTQLGASILCQF